MALQNPNQLFPMFVTDRIAETRKFYLERLGFQLVHDMGGYLQVRHGQGDGAPELCFMAPGAWPPSDGPAPDAQTFPGHGVVISLPTESADAKYEAVRGAGVEPTSKPEDRPWGWRSFQVTDPNGVVLDFFHVYKEAPAGANASS